MAANAAAGTSMADCPIEPDTVQTCRCFLEMTLKCLNEAGLHQAAAHVDVALMLCEGREFDAFKRSAGEDAPSKLAERPQQQLDQLLMADAVSTKNIERLYRDIVDRNIRDEETILRIGHFIATNHRPARATTALQNGSADQFHTFLSAGASSSAALTLMEPSFSYTVSREAARSYLASVVIPGTDREVSAEGETFASALVAAYLGALITP
jgi:hypothetical protein